MKITQISLILCLALTMSLSTYAQEFLPNDEDTTITSDTEREITMKDAPMLVQNAIKSDAYTGWKAEKIMHIIKDGKEYYKVKFSKGDEEMYQKFHKDGTLKTHTDGKKKDGKENKSRK